MTNFKFKFFVFVMYALVCGVVFRFLFILFQSSLHQSSVEAQPFRISAVSEGSEFLEAGFRDEIYVLFHSSPKKVMPIAWCLKKTDIQLVEQVIIVAELEDSEYIIAMMERGHTSMDWERGKFLEMNPDPLIIDYVYDDYFWARSLYPAIPDNQEIAEFILRCRFGVREIDTKSETLLVISYSNKGLVNDALRKSLTELEAEELRERVFPVPQIDVNRAPPPTQ